MAGAVRRRRGRRIVLLGLVALLMLSTVCTGPGAHAQTPPGTAPPTTAAPQERTVKVAVSVLDPFVVKRSGDTYGGFSIELWEDIAKRNHYRSQYIEKPTVEAQIEAVRSGEADVAVGAVTVNPARAQVVDFTEPTLNSGLQMMGKTTQSSTMSGLWKAVTDPAVLLLLALMGATIGVAAVAIWLLERRNNPDFAHKFKKGIGEGTWWASVTMLTIGYGDSVPRTFLGRTFSIVWMLFGMLLVAAVTATFTANLTIHRLNSDIRTPDDLRDHKVVAVKDSTAAAYLNQKKITFRAVGTTDEMVTAVRAGQDEVAVDDAPVLARAVHESEGNLALIGPQFTHSYDAIAVARSSDLRQPINQTLLGLNADGTYDRIYRSWFTI